MKFNWGHAIITAFALFIGYILFMVITMATTHTDIVEEDYYAQQIDYETKKVATENANPFASDINLHHQSEKMVVEFPEAANMEQLNSGEFWFYRKENKAYDMKFAFNPEGKNIQVLPLEELKSGNYELRISWKAGDKDYFTAKEVIIE